MWLLVFGLLLLVGPANAQVGLPWPGPGAASSVPLALTCDAAAVGCGVAYSYNRKLKSTYAGAAFQLQYGPPLTPTGTFDVSFATPYADIAAHCQGANADACTISKIYDQAGASGGPCDLLPITTVVAGQTAMPLSISPVTGFIRFWRPANQAGQSADVNANFIYQWANRYGGGANTSPCGAITNTGNTDISTTMVGEDGFYDVCCSAWGIEDNDPAVVNLGSGWSLGWRGLTLATIDAETYVDCVSYSSTPPQLYRGLGVYRATGTKEDFYINGSKLRNNTAAVPLLFNDCASPSGFTTRIGEAGIVGPHSGDNTDSPGGKNYEFAVFLGAVTATEGPNIQAEQLAFYGTPRTPPNGHSGGLLTLFEVLPLVQSAALDTAIGNGLDYPESHSWSFRLNNPYYAGRLMRVRNGNTNNEFDIVPDVGQPDVTTALQAGNGTTGGPGCTTDNTTTPCFVKCIDEQSIMGGISACQTTNSKQPQVWFNASPNGKTAMKCTSANLTSLATPATSPVWSGSNPNLGHINNTIMASGQRIANFTSVQGLFDTPSSGDFMGFDSVANQAYSQPPAFHSGLTASATDNQWHNFIATHSIGGGGGDGNFAADTGTLPAPTDGIGTSLAQIPIYFCGNSGSGFNYLDGYWGEVTILSGGVGGTGPGGGRTNPSAYHTNQSNYW